MLDTPHHKTDVILAAKKTAFGLSCLLLAASTLARAADHVGWPTGYVVDEESPSPDGRVAVLIPTEGEEFLSSIVNYLADVKQHRVLGKIKADGYYLHERHWGMEVDWVKDSSWGIVEYNGRYGFNTLTVVEPNASGFEQAEIGKKIQTSLDSVLAKASHDKEEVCSATLYRRLGADRKLRVRAIGTTNPRSIADDRTFAALFQGTYELDGHRWKVSDVRLVPPDLQEALGAAFDGGVPDSSSDPDETRLANLDELMNSVYQGLRFLLPPDRFARVKQEQKAWLEKRDATPAIAAKCALLQARIDTLENLAW